MPKVGEYSLASASGLTYVPANWSPLAAEPAMQACELTNAKDALVAQLDRALDYESRGREFESSRARHFPSSKVRGPRNK